VDVCVCVQNLTSQLDDQNGEEENHQIGGKRRRRIFRFRLRRRTRFEPDALVEGLQRSEAVEDEVVEPLHVEVLPGFLRVLGPDLFDVTLADFVRRRLSCGRRYKIVAAPK
jgi:hypothetical protein